MKIRYRRFCSRIFDVYFINFINKEASNSKTSQANRVSKSDKATKQAQRLKEAFNVTLRYECFVKRTLTSNLVWYRQYYLAMNIVSQQETKRQD